MTDEISNDVVLEKPVTETTVEAPTFDGLSNREALEKAVELTREGKSASDVRAPTNTEVKQAVREELEPPSGFSKEGIEAWKRKDVSAIQKEYRRIYDARTVELTRAQTSERKAREEAEKERGEARTWRELGEMAKPYIEARGADGVPPQKAIMEALALINEFKKNDPATVKAELKKIGIDLDAAPSQPTHAPDPEIDDLRKFKEEYKRDKETQHLEKLTQTFENIFDTLGSQKTRTGEPVFPGLLDNSEAGNKFAYELGSLTKDPGYQALVRRRFPDADLTVITREAYIALGGKVSGEPVKVSTQSNQQHIERSRRASAATPGRTSSRVNDSNLNGKLSNRAALIKAMELHREH